VKFNVSKTYVCLLLLLSGIAQSAPDSQPFTIFPQSLRVASSNSFPPINMLDKEGQLTGFGRDLSDAVLKSMNIKPVRRHSAIWTDVLSWLDTGQIDFIHDTGYTKDRDAYLDYTIPIIEMPEIIFVKNARLDINTLDSLKGKTVACVNNHITHLYLQQYTDIKCHIVYKPIEGLYALMGGTVDAFVYPREIVMYFAQQLRVADEVKMVGEPLRYLSWSMTVKEGNAEVISVLNEGIKRIKENGEYERIYNKWFGKRLLAGYTESEVRIIVISVVVLSLFAGISVVLLFYNRRLNNAKEALEHSEKKYSEIAASVPGAVFQICKYGDNDCRMEFISLGMATSIGVSSQQLLGNLKNFSSHIYIDDRMKFLQSLQESIQNHSPWQTEFRIETTRQEILWFQVSSTPKELDKDLLTYNGILLNITDHKELQERQEHFFQLSNNMLCIAGFDGYFKLLNPSWVTTLGFSMNELKSQPFLNFVHPEDQQLTINEAQKLGERKGTTINFENRYRCKNGEYKYLSWMAVSSPYAEEIYAAAHDITDLKNAEEELRRAYDGLETRVEQRTIELKQANEHLQQAEQAMREAKEEADRANLAKSEFLSRMSHELRTPLNAVLGFAQLIETDPELQGTEQSEFANEIYTAGNHLLELINEVLDLSKIEAGQLTVVLEPVDMCKMLDECLSLVRPQADARGIRIFLPQWKQETYVEGDKLRLKQVILNLLSNAVKYNIEGGSIRIDCEINENSKIEFSISDTGHGMSQAELDNLFQPFNRLGAENSEIEGTGIGLVITKKLVELMNGSLHVSSEQGKGSCFALRLKGVEEDVATGSERSAEHVGHSVFRGSGSSNRQRILYIEDNKPNIRLMQQILTKMESVEFDIAETAEEGIELAISKQPNLILMDINLPGMNGYEALQKLQSIPSLSNTPVVAITADAMHDSYDKGIAAGFSDYVVKPLEVSVLLNVISKQLAQTKAKQFGS